MQRCDAMTQDFSEGRVHVHGQKLPGPPPNVEGVDCGNGRTFVGHVYQKCTKSCVRNLDLSHLMPLPVSMVTIHVRSEKC